MEVILQFAHIDPWVGITKYKNCFDYIGTYLTRSGNKYTGLTVEDARRLEKELGFDENYLAPSSAHWKTYNIKLGAKKVVLHTEDPHDELAYLFLKGHKRVANGLINVTPNHDYVIINANAEAEENNRISRRKRDAFAEFNKMSIDNMRKCLRLYGIKSDNISNELVENKLFELIEKNPDRYFLLWVDNKNKETQFIIEEAVAKNIIRKSKTVYYYGTDVIGRSLEDAISYLNDKTNQDLKMAILESINVK